MCVCARACVRVFDQVHQVTSYVLVRHLFVCLRPCVNIKTDSSPYSSIFFSHVNNYFRGVLFRLRHTIDDWQVIHLIYICILSRLSILWLLIKFILHFITLHTLYFHTLRSYDHPFRLSYFYYFLILYIPITIPAPFSYFFSYT